MKTKNTVRLTRKETNRRLETLTLDAWKNLSGYVGNCHVNAWTAGSRKMVDRISVYPIAKRGGNLAEAFNLAKELFAKTGIVTHFHGGKVSGNISKEGIFQIRERSVLPLP